MSPAISTVLLLIVSNVFMTLAWYGHLKLQESGMSLSWPLVVVILFSLGIALAEYSFMIPSNRIGYSGNGGPFSLMQLKVIQEAVTLAVFTAVVTVLFKGEQFHWNHLVAFLLLVGAVWFAFLPVGK